MPLSLIAIDGSLKGAVFPLKDAQISIGRDNSNDLVVDDLAASRCHCTIEFVPGQPGGGRYKLVDLESRNGTFVNGLPVRERWLEQGDEIKVGVSVFLFSAFSGEPTDRPNIPSAEPITRSTSQLRREDAIYLHPEKLGRSLPDLGRAARDVKALLRISSEIHQAESREDLYRRVLELILQTIHAGAAAVFLRAKEPGECEFAFGMRRDGTECEPFGIVRSIAQQVIVQAMAIIADSAEAAPRPSAVVTILAAPLVCFDQIEGLLYLSAAQAHARFDDADLQLLTAVGSIAGLALANISRLEDVQAENARLRVETQLQHEMIGESAPMRQVYDFITKVAPSDVSVLIDGENGTGKELVARAIHRNSPRAARPFIAVNCAALTESLLETELFGHEKGAFTGAIGLKKGKFEIADSGSIFLDEIAELAPSIQSKLLRVLQERELDRVGGTKSVKIDVRVIAATNRDLQLALKNGTFRQDLFFRLNVVSITMPPLRQRREDIPLLANYFAAKASARAGRRIVGISKQAQSWLMQYDWPGNVRELENAIERAVVMGSSDVLMPEDLPESILECKPAQSIPIDRYHEALNQAKRAVVMRALEQAHGVQTEAAKLLEIHPVYLNRLMRKMDLKARGEPST
jgi:transcriptional regulator with GAF, ATPase, and Fis domain